MTDDIKNCDKVAEHLRATYEDFRDPDPVFVIYTKNDGEISETATGKTDHLLAVPSPDRCPRRRGGWRLAGHGRPGPQARRPFPARGLGDGRAARCHRHDRPGGMSRVDVQEARLLREARASRHRHPGRPPPRGRLGIHARPRGSAPRPVYYGRLGLAVRLVMAENGASRPSGSGTAPGPARPRTSAPPTFRRECTCTTSIGRMLPWGRSRPSAACGWTGTTYRCTTTSGAQPWATMRPAGTLDARRASGMTCRQWQFHLFASRAVSKKGRGTEL